MAAWRAPACCVGQVKPPPAAGTGPGQAPPHLAPCPPSGPHTRDTGHGVRGAECFGPSGRRAGLLGLSRGGLHATPATPATPPPHYRQITSNSVGARPWPGLSLRGPRRRAITPTRRTPGPAAPMGCPDAPRPPRGCRDGGLGWAHPGQERRATTPHANTFPEPTTPCRRSRISTARSSSPGAARRGCRNPPRIDIMNEPLSRLLIKQSSF